MVEDNLMNPHVSTVTVRWRLLVFAILSQTTVAEKLVLLDFAP